VGIRVTIRRTRDNLFFRNEFHPLDCWPDLARGRLRRSARRFPTSRHHSQAGVSARLFPGFRAEDIQGSGARIHVLSKGSGPPLLLLHGHPETHVARHKVAPALTDRYTVIVRDLRGYGDSSKPRYSPRSESASG
jgi:alpha/beta hydrolase fold